MEDYRLSLARSYRQSVNWLRIDRARVQKKAADLYPDFAADREANGDEVPTLEQFGSALWEWLNAAVSELLDYAGDWVDCERGPAADRFEEALARALRGRPYDQDAYMEAEAAKLEAEYAAAQKAPRA